MSFRKTALPTVYFSEKIWVYCPKCSKPAVVKTKLPRYTIPFPFGYKSTCNCSYCGYQNSDDKKWMGYLQGFVNQPCRNCGTGITYATKPTKDVVKTTKITCEKCSVTKEYEIKWYRYRKNKPTDPYFGFDLWLQTTIKGNLIWLYNIDHLNYLYEYVNAKLREDDSRYKYSMITNLPQWVKSSKNRDLLLNKLSKLKREFEKK